MFARSGRHARFRFRSRRTRILVALATIALLVTGISATVVTADTKPAQAIGLTTQAPAWLVKYIQGQARGQDARIMEDLGYRCYGTPFVCVQDTDYDPPRWFYGATVRTGNGPNGFLRARGWPGMDAPIIRTFPEGWKLVIFCQTTGPEVNGLWGPTKVWNYIGHYGEAPMFVSDGFVHTGTNQVVSGDCGATGMGGNR